MPEVRLDGADAAELAEILEFLSEWLTVRLAASLEQFVGHPAYGLDELRGDLERFVFLLGGSDSQTLFGP